ncbi:MAG TPA: NPXTG-anchored protein [Acidimicrobiales bacterium]|nr:NPXTG-anchored protein [Acidimicrobiales bacterium]
MLLVGITTATFAGGAAPVGAQVPAAQADYKGYSTGTVVHADALTVGATRIVDTEVAYSGASVASKGTGGVTQGPGAAAGTIVNEMEQVVQPALPNTTLDPSLQGNRSFGRGSGLEIGVGTTVSTDVNANQILLAQRALASAPPSTDLITKEVGPVKIDPAAYASLLRGQAQARWNGDSTCVVGEDLSTGLGYAADAQLLNLGAPSAGNDPFTGPVAATDAPTPERRVSQTRSVTKLVPQTDAAGNKIGDNFGLMSETRMTIAPITLLKNTATPLTIELLGEWVLRSVATGIPGQAYVTYGPGTVTPSTPVLSLIQGGLVNNLLTLQDLLGAQGLPIEIPGVASIVIGEDPRAIGGDSTTQPTQGGDGTVASAAVDAVRIQLLPAGALAGIDALDLRIGHMESRAQVPAGGVKCNVPVSKTADKQTVNAGDSFTYNITVTNPFADCDLTNVKVVDNITGGNGVKWSVTGTNPQASATSTNQVTFNDIGPIGPKQSKSVTISIKVDPKSAAGQFTDNATATGTCATGSAQGGARITVPISGETTVTVPSVSGGRELPATGVEQLPRTGSNGPALALAGLGLLGAAAVLRRIRHAATN